MYVRHAEAPSFGDTADHGTHVAGSIAGAMVDRNGSLVMDRAIGAAPFARLSIYDLADSDLYWPGTQDLPYPFDFKMFSVRTQASIMSII